MTTDGKIVVEPEGRPGIWLADRESLKAWITAQDFEAIHNMATSVPGMLLGADHSVAGVLADIDTAERVALMTGEAFAHNMGHALALIMPPDPPLPERLEMFDIGEIAETDLAPGPLSDTGEAR
ncbi:MAG: hypothetical protein ACLP62_01360 [Acidimicrobiales bacterium]